MTRILPEIRTIFVCLTLLGLAGCAGVKEAGVSIVSKPQAGTQYIGMVHGGQQPVAGASIQLYVLGSGLDGAPGTPLLATPVKTDAGGNFSIDPSSYTCPNYGSLTYMTATGGNPGLPGVISNQNIAELAMTDACSPLAQKFIDINEVTTVASVFFYGQYFSKFPNIGLSSTNGAAAYQYLLQYEAIIDPARGVSPGPKYASGDTFPVPTMYSLANVIATCVNSSGGSAGENNPCGRLFSLTTPPGGAAPSNTVDALVNLYRNPHLNVPQIFALSSPSAPFQPSLGSAPPDWYLRYTTGTPATPKFDLCSTWGDSLTQGDEDGSGVTLAIALTNLPSCYAGDNQGVGGQTSTAIGIREGGVQTTATIIGGVIPFAGPVGITFPTDSMPVDKNGPAQLPIRISGVDGLVSFDYSTYTTVFTRTTPGIAVASPPNSALTVDVGNQNSGFVVIWAGRNNSGDQPTILSNIAAMVAVLPSPKHFVVLSLTNRDSDFEFKGAPGYGLIAGINQAIAAAYPNNYLDIRSAVVAAYDPSSAEDVIDYAHDVPPASERAVDAYGNLVSGIDASSCTFAVAGGIASDYTMLLEQEKIRIVMNSDFQHVTSCLRGYAGTQAVPHAANTAFTGIDFIHLNGKADLLIAQLIDHYIQTH